MIEVQMSFMKDCLFIAGSLICFFIDTLRNKVGVGNGMLRKPKEETKDWEQGMRVVAIVVIHSLDINCGSYYYVNIGTIP